MVVIASSYGVVIGGRRRSCDGDPARVVDAEGRSPSVEHTDVVACDLGFRFRAPYVPRSWVTSPKLGISPFVAPVDAGATLRRPKKDGGSDGDARP